MFLTRYAFSLLFITSALQVEPAAEPIAKATWEPVYNLEIQLSHTSNKAAKISSTVAAVLSAVSATRTRIRIAEATAKDRNRTIALEALSIALSQKEQALQGDAATKNELAIRAAAVSSTLRGRITEAISILLLGDTATTGTGYCLATTGGTATAKVDITRLGCDQSLTQLSPEDKSPDAEHMSTTGFDKIAAATSVYSDTGGQSNKCTMLNIGSTAATNSFNSGTLAAGLIKITGTTTGTLGSYKTGLSAKTRDSTDLVKAAFYDATAIKNIQLAQYITDEIQIAKAEARKATLKPIVAKLLQQRRPTREQTQRDRDAEEMIDAVFGTDTEKIPKLWEELQRKQVKGNQADPNKEEPLSGVSTLSELQEVLSYYEDFSRKHAEELQSKIDQLESQNSQKDVKSLEQICNSKEDSKTCNDDKNCKYDDTKAAGKKCTLNEKGKEAEKAAEEANKEAGGKDGKPTNTTGSSSFVINKAPLLLAFLIL
ncbi:variant surface glycoprotein (VSG), putative [Trypanosoma equiperdum]|uniref:Variant surface glycoprotein (VSG), putative n=2 Tax=Trypanozoon TaxID=39700 RepID=Q4FKA3_TRYB2|nr:variant surface glycoprotein (VSG), putative [Trypanosoma brucei brucei TREU927]SCU66208.1 variant surface glycoprotein (VSG), putative [Trypanosoma equiperdum]